MDYTITPTIQELERLACKAGEILRRGYGKDHRISYKSAIDLVTEVDRESEDYLLKEILQRYPHHQVMAEESGLKEGESSCRWYIDPLDGTVNYAHGIPIFAVAIAFSERNELRLGVVYDPMRDECFSAEKGKGARLNGESIHVSDAAALSNALLVTGFPYDIQTNQQNNLNHYIKFSMVSQGVRRLGSAALDLCYVACGRFDGYWEIRLNAWDIAAGGLIAAEAGATVTNIQGEGKYLRTPFSILAANPAIHEQMMGVLGEK
ncbi:MAG: inositol monophosphatase [Chloroflexi bacterium]|nr:MAG: inositol monophosphatase [Chloroflexota bacterium]